MMSIVVAGAGVEPSYPERVVGAQPGPLEGLHYLPVS